LILRNSRLQLHCEHISRNQLCSSTRCVCRSGKQVECMRNCFLVDWEKSDYFGLKWMIVRDLREAMWLFRWNLIFSWSVSEKSLNAHRVSQTDKKIFLWKLARTIAWLILVLKSGVWSFLSTIPQMIKNPCLLNIFKCV
jgi:hypothetical protein